SSQRLNATFNAMDTHLANQLLHDGCDEVLARLPERHGRFHRRNPNDSSPDQDTHDHHQWDTSPFSPPPSPIPPRSRASSSLSSYRTTSPLPIFEPVEEEPITQGELPDHTHQ